MTKTKESEVLRLFLGGSNIGTICRQLSVTQETAFDIIFANPVTGDLLRSYIDISKERGYHPFFSSPKLGRDKLPEHKKRKIRQVRISDEEMEALGNPSSSEIRRNLIRLRKIEQLLNRLDDAGIDVIPSEWIAEEYPSDEAFWIPFHKSQYWRLLKLSEHERLIRKLTD
ncbi:hypothetical protein MKZ17_03725 [Solibacillus sp. FSL R7-0682]|uniref:hypothetical protein n=1 Tax=Solibacillus sp. FSL R7-0682 TaxID=2921690 RepID=UPI0030F9664F